MYVHTTYYVHTVITTTSKASGSSKLRRDDEQIGAARSTSGYVLDGSCYTAISVSPSQPFLSS
jgi:hypothetical protein